MLVRMTVARVFEEEDNSGVGYPVTELCRKKFLFCKIGVCSDCQLENKRK